MWYLLPPPEKRHREKKYYVDVYQIEFEAEYLSAKCAEKEWHVLAYTNRPNVLWQLWIFRSPTPTKKIRTPEKTRAHTPRRANEKRKEKRKLSEFIIKLKFRDFLRISDDSLIAVVVVVVVVVFFASSFLRAI